MIWRNIIFFRKINMHLVIYSNIILFLKNINSADNTYFSVCFLRKIIFFLSIVFITRRNIIFTNHADNLISKCTFLERTSFILPFKWKAIFFGNVNSITLYNTGIFIFYNSSTINFWKHNLSRYFHCGKCVLIWMIFFKQTEPEFGFCYNVIFSFNKCVLFL